MPPLTILERPLGAVLLSVLLPALSATSAGAAPVDIATALTGCDLPDQLPPGGCGELQRHEIDVGHYPDALCNDGRAAVLFFRPFVGDANMNRWVISLRGGGGCTDGGSCAARWCSCGSRTRCPYATALTGFDQSNMVAPIAPHAPANGVLERGDAEHPNPLGDYNQVILSYCSSDLWAGVQRALPLTSLHPRTGVPVAFMLPFLGAKILEADLDTLRRVGRTPLLYTRAAQPRELPDLDESEEVVITGDSAGGRGVITHIDAITQLLRKNHAGPPTPRQLPEVIGLIDAAVAPDLRPLFPAGAPTTYEGYLGQIAGEASAAGERHDASCEAWHRQQSPPTPAYCSDSTHVLRHHLTTPFFIRMSLFDQLATSTFSELPLFDPFFGPVDARVFGAVLARELSQFRALRNTAEEGAQMRVAPGVFAPACTRHDTIHDDEQVYDVTIQTPTHQNARLFDVYQAWRTGGPGVLVSVQRKDSQCRD